MLGYLMQYYIGSKLKFKDGETTPAPGFYQPSYDLTRSRVVGSAIDKANRTEPLRPQSATVGPGFYEVKSKVAGPYYGYSDD